MKKILLLLAVVAAVAFMGCSNDDDNGRKEPSKEITLKGYDEPIVEWGISKQQVKSRVAYKLSEETETALNYEGKDMVSLYTYVFENDALAVSSALVNVVYMDNLGAFLSKKYVPAVIDEDEYTFYYLNKKNTMVVAVKILTPQYLLVMYAPFGSSNKTSFMDKLPITGENMADDGAQYETFRQFQKYAK